MLLRKDLRRCQHRRLKAVVQRDEHTEQGHERLPAAHVALQQAVHLLARAHVLADLLHDTLLRTGELKRKMVGIERIEVRSHMCKNVALHILLHQQFLLEELKLDVEQLLEFKPLDRYVQALLVLREVSLRHGLLPADAAKLLHQCGTERFRQHAVQLRQQRMDQFPDTAAVQAFRRGLFGGAVHGLQRGGGTLVPRQRGLDLRVRQVEAVPEPGRFAVDDVLAAVLQDRLEPAEAPEPHQLDCARGVRQFRREPPCLLLADHADLLQHTSELNRRSLFHNFGHGVEAHAVHVAEGIV